MSKNNARTTRDNLRGGHHHLRYKQTPLNPAGPNNLGHQPHTVNPIRKHQRRGGASTHPSPPCQTPVTHTQPLQKTHGSQPCANRRIAARR